MAKKLFLLTAVIMFLAVVMAQAVDFGPVLTQIASELIKSGVATADVNAVQASLGSLLESGITKENLVKIVTGLVGLGINGDILNNPLQALKSLVQSGQKPDIASNLISLAIDQAKAQNLTGVAAVTQLVDFINQKTTEFLSLSQQAQASAQDPKAAINKSLGTLLGK